MVVRVTDNIRFPDTGWLISDVVGSHNGRYLVKVLGPSGISSWVCGLMTFPQDALTIAQEYKWSRQKVTLLSGDYEVVETYGLLRFYPTTTKPDYILFSVYGHLVPEASSEGVQVLLETDGYSRTGRSENRWGLFVAPVESIVAVESYDSGGDPIYYRVTEFGVEKLGSTLNREKFY